MNTHSLTLALALFLSACAGVEKRPNKVYEGNLSFKGPDYALVEEGLPSKKSRGLASVSEKAIDKAQKNKTRNSKLLGYNNKMIYFLTLYSQFLNFKKLSSSQSEINICPGFHSVLVSNNEEFTKIKKSNTVVLGPLSTPSNEEEVKLFPQYFLPATIEAQHPSVWDLGQGKTQQQLNELLAKSIQLHTEKLFIELRELCEYGQSDNYFIFENLVTHIQEHGAFRPGREGLSALLKTSVFSNMYLIYALDKNLAQNSFEKEVISRMDSEWLNDYFREVNKRREKLARR